MPKGILNGLGNGFKNRGFGVIEVWNIDSRLWLICSECDESFAYILDENFGT